MSECNFTEYDEILVPVPSQPDVEYVTEDELKEVEERLSDYNNIENKPSINGVTLEGNLTSDDLKIVSKTKLVEHGTNDTTFTLPPNEFHTWGEIASLDITLQEGEEGVVNEYWFAFTSGASPTTLILPDTVISDIGIQANTRYECNIVNNYLVFQEWSVTNG